MSILKERHAEVLTESETPAGVRSPVVSTDVSLLNSNLPISYLSTHLEICCFIFQIWENSIWDWDCVGEVHRSDSITNIIQIIQQHAYTFIITCYKKRVQVNAKQFACYLLGLPTPKTDANEKKGRCMRIFQADIDPKILMGSGISLEPNKKTSQAWIPGLAPVSCSFNLYKVLAHL